MPLRRPRPTTSWASMCAFAEPDLAMAAGDSDDCTKQCTDDECAHTRGCR